MPSQDGSTCLHLLTAHTNGVWGDIKCVITVWGVHPLIRAWLIIIIKNAICVTHSHLK